MEAPVTADHTPRLARAFAEACPGDRTRGRAGDRRSARARSPDADRPARQQPRLARGRAGSRQDDARTDHRRRHRLLVQPDPVHAGPDARGHHRANILIEEGGQRVFQFQPGPIFANLVLADEINRATPKTQSSLLEAMQSTRSPSRGNATSSIAVLRPRDAEPLEMEGTYPCPKRSSTGSCSRSWSPSRPRRTS